MSINPKFIGAQIAGVWIIVAISTQGPARWFAVFMALLTVYGLI